MRILPLQKLLSMIVMLCATVMAFAQPANDDCSTPTLLVVGADAASCTPVLGDTRGTVDATTVMGPEVCSGSWYTDDVWYSFETGATTPEFGVTIEVRLDPSSGTELLEHGLAIYTDCETTSMPIFCFSDEPGRRTIAFPPQCLDPNSTYLVRLWSSPEPVVNSGTFSICAYESVEDDGGGEPTEPAARVIYEETFDKGFNGWTSVSESMSSNPDGDMVADDWVWTNTGCIPTAFGTSDCLTVASEACREVGVVGMPAGWYQTNRTGDPSIISQPYNAIISYFVSPSINLSKESCVNLTWTEAFRGLNGGGTSDLGPLVEFSVDGGETWNVPSQAINSSDVSINYGGEYVVNGPYLMNDRSIPLIGAEGNADVTIRFGFTGDFYSWLLDNIRVVEGASSDGIAQANFFARAPINPMSIHMVDSYDFLIDIVNLACEDQTNVNVNVTGLNGTTEVYNEDLFYGTIMSDELAENIPFNKPFTPAAEVATYDFTYTLSSDMDDDLSNNVRTFSSSVVDETVFRKESGTVTGALTPNTNEGVFWAAGEPFAWEMGNIFYAPNSTSVGGMPLRFTDISFQLSNANELMGQDLRIWLYKIMDNDFDGIIAKDNSEEITRLGFTEYEVTGIENGLITVSLESFLGDIEDLDIEANTHYMATVESVTEVADGIAMGIANDESYDYAAAIFNARDNADGDLTKIRYAHSFAISKEGYFRISPSTTMDLTTGNFNESSTPIIRLAYAPIDGNATTNINENISIAVSPNPTAADLTVTLSIEEATDMQISIVDLTGRVITTKSFDSVTELREDFNVSKLSNGVYMIHIDTKDGVQTKKFVVSK